MTTTARYSRRPALLVLGLCALVAFACYKAGATNGSQAAGPSLEAIERAIADPDAGADLWLLYGQRLLDDKRYGHAVMAFERVLEKDPYCRAANLHCATALSLAGDADRFYAFVEKLVLIDPRLTQDILGRPESQPYLQAERFKSVESQARVQSMD
jgi:tetratricopeptide (TPR) repeat protein